MIKIQFLVILGLAFLINNIDCRRNPFSAISNFKLQSTTTLPTTVQSTAAINEKIQTKKNLFKKDDGLEYVYVMLGNTKSTTTTPPSTTPLSSNPIESLIMRSSQKYCVDKTGCVSCPFDQGTTCCYKKTNKGLTTRGECRCVTKQSELSKCD